jgi:(1->4)-alpha-D-glucan 1-alpha-D-glucosylmutase
MTAPRATYRLQLRGGMDFDRAAGLADYLADLGVSHVYLSPILEAAAGSSHGYDVVDPTRIDPALGGAEGHARLTEALRARGLGQIVDLVPNHMAIGSRANAWWWDVLENGPASHYAAYFDIDWKPRDCRIVLPILGERYGAALAGGLIAVVRRGGQFVVTYHEHELPVAPRSLGRLLASVAAQRDHGGLGFLADALAELPSPASTDRASVARRHRDKAVLARLLDELLTREPGLAAAVDEALAGLPRHPDALDDLLERQNWRLVYWRCAASELDYRRFFDIDTLVGLNADDPEVFRDTHVRLLELIAAGALDGLRIDHVDGLRDPAAYLERLRQAAPGAWLVVEKILAPGERLPPWPIDGTTGYDFMRLVDGAFVDPAATAVLDDVWRRMASGATSFAEMSYAARRGIIEEVLAAERNRLVELALALANRPLTRDITRSEMSDALSELLAVYPVYRTYARPGAPLGAADRAYLDAALTVAAGHCPTIDEAVWALLGDALRLDLPGELAEELALRFQQTTVAIMAKGVEDTACYRHARFVALNEVGGDPAELGVGLDELHDGLAQGAGLLSGTTHDTKRGEDVRARLAVLSEVPERWAQAVARWSSRAARYRRGDAPDPAMEYFLWQTLVGAWPISQERAVAYATKAMREAKARTSWLRPDEDYEAAVHGWIAGVLGDRELAADLAGFVAEIAPAGFVNGLARTLIRLTAPGVPDVYQGAEVWDLRLVDPDNRSPVDFDRLGRLAARARESGPEEAMAGLADGLPKLWLIRRVLGLRRERPALFDAPYRRLPVDGPDADRVIAFGRGDGLAVVVPRRMAPEGGFSDATTVELPAGRWRDRLGEGERSPADGALDLAAAWRRFPVALLERQG